MWCRQARKLSSPLFITLIALKMKYGLFPLSLFYQHTQLGCIRSSSATGQERLFNFALIIQKIEWQPITSDRFTTFHCRWEVACVPGTDTVIFTTSFSQFCANLEPRPPRLHTSEHIWPSGPTPAPSDLCALCWHCPDLYQR